MPQMQELNVRADRKGGVHFFPTSKWVSVSECLWSGPSTANGAAGSQQAEVGPGLSHTSRLHRALPVQAEDLPVHQADPQETRPDFRGSLCYR